MKLFTTAIAATLIAFMAVVHAAPAAPPLSLQDLSAFDGEYDEELFAASTALTNEDTLINPFRHPDMDNVPMDAEWLLTVEGLNNYSCVLTKERPRPVILIHGTLFTGPTTWPVVAPILIRERYCVFSMTYGRYKNSIFGGIGPIQESAKEVGVFINHVMDTLKARQVDLVGHSQGGIIGRQWIKFGDGKGKVKHMIGISAIHHGTHLSSLAVLAQDVGIFDLSRTIVNTFAPGLFQMVNSSSFMHDLNEGGDTSPGVIHANLATKYDQIVTPWNRSWQYGPNVKNDFLQDFCSIAINAHATILYNKITARYVLNQLDPSTAKKINCLTMFF